MNWPLAPCRVFRRSGIKVPDEISVVGFDNHQMAEYFELTTVAQEVRTRRASILLARSRMLW